jgi:hypothetical protein
MKTLKPLLVPAAMVVLFVGIGWGLAHWFFLPAPVRGGAAAAPAAGKSSSAFSSSTPAPDSAVSADKPGGFDRNALLLEGDELAARWPESKEEARRRAQELAAVDPVAALTLLSVLHNYSFEGVTTWQREIIRDWARKDPEAMQASWEALSRQGLTPEHWISITASVMQRENKAGLDHLLGWLGRLDQAGERTLPIMTLEKILTHYDPQSFGSVGNFLLQRAQDPIYREYLVRATHLQAQKNPDEALTMIGRMPNADLRAEALEAVVAGATHKDPGVVAEWLNSGRIFGATGLASTLAPAEQATMRDRALKVYFEALVFADPDYVATYSQAIQDPKMRAELQKMADVVAKTAIDAASAPPVPKP